MNTNQKTISHPMERHAIKVDFREEPGFRLEVNSASTKRFSLPAAATAAWIRPVARLASVALAAFALAVTKPAANAAIAGSSVDLSVLVITAQTNDYSLETIREALDFLGTPYEVHVAVDNPGSLTPDRLRAGIRGFYSGVIMTSASLGYTPDNGTTWLSALTPAEWTALEQYETDFGARRLNWYGYPTPDQGFNWAHGSLDTTTTPLSGQWTAAGSAHFGYLKTSNAYPIKDVWAFLATPLDANTSVWMTDGNGNALIASRTFPNGREVATKTFDSATWIINSSVLYHGLINWVTRGMFLGQRHTYVTAQVDDVFLADDIYTGGEYRQNSNDWHATIVWQQNFRQRPSGVNFRFDMAFNGLGTVPGEYANDSLTRYAKLTQGEFKWISHTFTHPYLTSFTYGQAMQEIVPNNQKAVELGLSVYSIKNMVTPNITGLENPGFLNAAYDAGIRYLVTDTSIPAHRAPSPNAGIPNWYVPGILMIPRHANNLFYNVSTPAQWVAEYNFLYSSYWGRNLNYSEILEDQSDLLLRPLLKGDVSPQMFHQPNLRAYNAPGNTLLGDLLDKVADKYEYYYNFPFLSPTQDKLGETVQARMDYNASGVQAIRNGDDSITFTVTKAAVVPVTGMKSPGAELYAGQWITFVQLAAGQSVTYSPNGQGGYVVSGAPVNNAPTAIAANVTTAEDVAVNITLQGTDPENNPLTFAVVSNPANGTLSGTVPNLTYTPNASVSGSDSFQFSVNDGEFTSTATVSITVTPKPNTAPTALAANVTTSENVAATVTLQGTDPENNPLTFAVVSNPALGTLSGIAPNLTYTPNTGVSGSDSFQFSANDGQFTSTATVSITVTPKPNTAPVANDASVSTTEGGPVTVTLQATDAENDPLTFSVSSNPTLGVLSGTAPALTYTPNTGVTGADSFQFTVSDGKLTGVGTVTVTIVANPVNTNIVITVDGNLNDWANVTSAGNGLDVANTAGNQIDLVALKLHHDANNLYIAYQNENAITLGWGYTLYFDTDRNPTTGFAMWSAGADYMIQGNDLFRYAGTGNDWNWTFVQTVTSSVNGANAEFSLPRAALGNPDSLHYLFYGENAAFGGANYEIVPASAVTGGQSYLRYNFVAAPVGGIQVDGNLADWTGAPLATDADDVTGANNPIDIRELRLDNDANKFYLAYVNESPVTLNWGYTLYLDTDSQANTGFSMWAVGAEYMIQGADLYRYTGTGNDWNWTWVATLETAVNGNVLEAAFPKTSLGNATSIRLAFYGENAAFGGTATDVVPQNAQGAATGAEYLTYTVK